MVKKSSSFIIGQVYAGSFICGINLLMGKQGDFSIFRLGIKLGWILFDNWVFSSLLLQSCQSGKDPKYLSWKTEQNDSFLLKLAL